ncbi:TPA: hypothetical protein QHL53_003417 [Proteus mirabilis]|nr:hypothetical protein [Proteus mirabilis]
MAITLVTGSVGAGKGLYCSMLACQAYRNGRRVASNYPLDMEKLSPHGTEPLSVIPKQFTYDDLKNLGRGCPEDEFENLGILLLDEISLFLNARTFKDAERLKFLDWFVHSRKYGWNVYCQVQASFMLDKQIVDGVSEFIIELSRLDSLRLPFMEFVFPKEFGVMAKRKSLLPHIVKYRCYLLKEKGRRTPIEKGSFRAKDYFGVHDTLSTFGSDADCQGAYSLLPAKQLKAMSQAPILPPSLPVTPTMQSTEIPDSQPVPLSSTLRLIGHIKTKGKMQLIVKDMSSGLVRYIPYTASDPRQRIESLEIEGEKVTFYSGITVKDKSLTLPSATSSPLPF